MICETTLPPNSVIEQDAKERLQSSPYAALRKLSCYFHFERGGLILRGQLSSYYEKQLAQEALAGLEGVVRVVNETEVVDSDRAEPLPFF